MYKGHVPGVTSHAQHVFSKSPQATIPRSSFNRSFGVKSTFNAGWLVPILADEMVPGDTFSLNMHAFARLATPKFPMMDNMYFETFFFFIPNRLVWDNWNRFNGEQRNPGDSTDFVVPQIVAPSAGGVQELDLADYFGIPTKVNDLAFNALHFRAYNLIYNEWFRDENIQNSLNVPTDNGPDSYTDYQLRRRGKRFDYFTSCLPKPQKGPDVLLPLGGSAPVVSNGLNFNMHTVNDPTDVAGQINATGAGLSFPGYAGTNSPSIWGVETGLETDLTAATAATINDLRLAFQTQKLYERDARGGTRYTEIIRSHFGVTSPDARLQRPEYIGGGSTPIIVNPVAQTSMSVGGDVLGQLAAYGVCAPTGHGFTYSATEHGVIIGLACVRADLNYQSGLDRMWSRRTRLDYYWPALSHLGEQAVLNKEIYAQGPAAIDPITNEPWDELAFGYNERYAEMRYKPALITGQFRSNAVTSLDSWHLAQEFANLPTLSPDFIVEDPPMDRVLALSNYPHILFDSFFNYRCVRPMPTYAVPGLVDHF